MIIMMEKVLKLSKVLTGVGASAMDFLKMIIFLQPQLFILTLPMSFLMSVLFTYARLNIDNEITIFRTAGISFKDISRPVFIFGLFCIMASLFTSFYLGPISTKKLREEITDIVTMKAPLSIKEGVFYTLYEDVIVLVKEKPSDNILKEVFIYDTRKKKNAKTIYAKEGEIVIFDDMKIGFLLKDGNVLFTDELSMTELRFGIYNMVISFTPAMGIKKRELTPRELLIKARLVPQNKKVPLQLEFHRRLTLPLMVLFISLLAPPLAMISGKTGRLGGLSLGMLVFALYYAFMIYSENMAKSNTVPHYVGGWLPILLFAVFSIILFRREGKR